MNGTKGKRETSISWRNFGTRSRIPGKLYQKLVFNSRNVIRNLENCELDRYCRSNNGIFVVQSTYVRIVYLEDLFISKILPHDVH